MYVYVLCLSVYRYVNISSLSFSHDGQFLCLPAIQRRCISLNWNNLDQVEGTRLPPGQPTWGRCSQQPAATSLLRCLHDEPGPAFAIVHLVSSGQKNVCTLAMIQKLPRLLVATTNGHLFIYNVDPLDGRVHLAHKHRLTGAATGLEVARGGAHERVEDQMDKQSGRRQQEMNSKKKSFRVPINLMFSLNEKKNNINIEVDAANKSLTKK
ncbi:hypothetical protein INR49_000980 [Caranx melampygus]|nr:hypothetical protein INR49_000980 [Caranx melampygus]